MKNLVLDIDKLKEVFNIETRQSFLEKEAKQKGLEPPKVLRSDLQEILNRGKSLAARYTLILLEFISDKSKHNFMDYTVFKKENELYEIFVLLSVKITQAFFDEIYHNNVEEEIHRLLRSGAFNEARRKNFELEKIKKFPVPSLQIAFYLLKLLNEPFGKDLILPKADLDEKDPQAVQAAAQADRISKVALEKCFKQSQLRSINWNFQYNNQKSNIKPNFIKMKPFEAKDSRSPLTSLVAPSTKFRLYEFEFDIFFLFNLICERKIRKDKITSVVRPSSSLKSRVPVLLEREMNKGTTKDSLYKKIKTKERLNNSIL